MEQDVKTPTQFELDWEKPMWIHNKQSNMGYYNLIVSIRDMSLWCKLGMKPNRHWTFKQVKEYFGLQGFNKNQVLQILEDFKDGKL